MISYLYKRLPPIDAEHFSLPDEELGKLILGWWILAQAENKGLNFQNNPQAEQIFGEKIVELTRQLPDDNANAEYDSLTMALRLAASGKFEAAGKQLKYYMNHSAEHRMAMNALLSRSEDANRGAKIRVSAKYGHESIHGNPVEKEARRREHLDLLDKIRIDNPTLSDRQVHIKASNLSMEVFGKNTSAKTFYRAEKKENL